jgi:CDP-glucose 4,6-dehydratase
MTFLDNHVRRAAGDSSDPAAHLNLEFWQAKRVFLTGHTGFKGSWLSLWLQDLGAQLVGYSLPAPTEPNLFAQAGVVRGMTSICGDILDPVHLRDSIQQHAPEFVFHLAAQSLVRRSYLDPVNTFATNVLGTVNVLEAVRNCPSVRAVVIVTSDKCYENDEKLDPYKESDRLGGFDPYSSSKACAELVTAAYRSSFFSGSNAHITGIGSARAGNVIGGGDWTEDQLVPDIVRAILARKEVLIRNPHAIRPWQHVMEPLCGYLSLAQKMYYEPEKYSQPWNFGPDESDAVTVSELLERFSQAWGPDLPCDPPRSIAIDVMQGSHRKEVVFPTVKTPPKP